MMSAPSSRIWTACRSAASTSPLSPSPENESGVTLTTPITYVREPQANSRPPILIGAGARAAISLGISGLMMADTPRD